jgi:hypothetical protein
MGPPWGGGGGGGKGKRPQAYCSKDSYFDSLLRPEDADAFGGAGLLLYRSGANGVEVLLASEKPWNPLANDYDPLAWNPVGGKKAWSGDYEAATTAARCLMEVFGNCEGAPTKPEIEKLCRSAPVVWYPNGRFALFVKEYTPEDGEVFGVAEKAFADVKEKGGYPFSPEEEGRTDAKGRPTQRWVKQIEELEWVSGADLLATEKRKPLTDLLKNLCLIGAFEQFLQEGTPPAAAPPPQPEGGEGDARRKGGKDSKGGGKKGKDYGGKNGGGKGKDKGGKGMKGAFGGKGKGMPNYANFAPMPPPPLNAQMYPIEMQRQMLGEKLYMTVQPMVSTPMTAQKVTGMLLELPMPELMPLLGPSPSERQLLKQRVDEAMEVLEAEEGQGAK